MIAVDTNLLIYAHRKDSDFHDKALSAVQGLAESGMRWSIPWPCIHEFLAITTHPRIFDPPTPPEVAAAAAEAWISAPTCELLGEGPGYFDILRAQIEKGHVSGPMVHDARIAALCIYHSIKTFWTADRDFSRFPELSVDNPLVSGP